MASELFIISLAGQTDNGALVTMRAPNLSEPMSNIFPTYQVPQESAMWGGAPQPVQQEDEKIIARTFRGSRADPLTRPPGDMSYSSSSSSSDNDELMRKKLMMNMDPVAVQSVISGSGRGPTFRMPDCEASTLNLKLQSVTDDDNCLLNSVTVPKIQRNDRRLNGVAHNNITNNNNVVNKVDDSKHFGALPFGRDIPNQKSDNDLIIINQSFDYDNFDTPNMDNNDQEKSNPGTDILCNKPIKSRTLLFNDVDNNLQQYSSPLRLRGGGESSLSTGTSGWGTPPSQQGNNNNVNNSSGWGTANPSNQNTTGTQQWNNNANRPPASSQAEGNKPTAGGQQATTSQSNSSGWGQPGAKPPAGSGPPPPPPTAAAAPANNNVPANPQANATNTTKQQLEQLNNMREAIFSTDGWGGHVNQDTQWDIPSSPEPPAMKLDGPGPPPWKPAVNNGTELWEANLRNGGQPPPQPQQKTPWGHTPTTNIGGTWGEEDDATDSSNVWTGVPNNQQQWGNNNSNTMWGGAAAGGGAGGSGGNGSGWGDPRVAPEGRPSGLGVVAMDGMRPDPRAATVSGLDQRPMDPREQIRQMTGGGITGRLNGAGTEYWGPSGPHAGPGSMHHPNKMAVGPGNTAGWEESPPTQRRGMPSYDDGTSLWGNPPQGFHWKTIPTGAGAMGGGRAGPPGMAPSGRKPDTVWGGAGGGGRNGWEGGMDGGPGGNWGEDSAGPWGKQKAWEGDGDWSQKSQSKPQLSKEQVWNSKQFRVLVDMGYKKEDVENALRMREMNGDEALEILSSIRARGNDAWGGGNRHEDHFEHNHFSGTPRGYPGIGGGPSGNQLGSGGGGFPPGAGPGLLNSMGGAAGQGNSTLINNISPAIVQKILTQQGNSGGGVGSQSFVGPSGGRPMQPQGQPSTQQLRMLVQQIQMAVQAGYLNHQILNQPLAPHTLVLLNQLLQHIKTLQQLNSQHQMATQTSKGNLTNPALMILITKTKQQIMNLQNQIQAQQAHYVKQQQQGINYTDYKSNPMHDSINALNSNFNELTMKDPNQQQSRLNQWINKDKDDASDFSRAPGPSKSVATSPNMGAPLGLSQPDGPWSTGRSGDTGWPDSNAVESANDVKDTQWAPPPQPSLTDLVPEFEPGKPWKGNQIKSIEDDPTITPGSVVRSPLSIAAINVKDNELFGINTSKSPPAPDAMQSLSSSTWSFNPPTTTAFASPQVKLPTSKVGLGDLNTAPAATSELWAAPKSRGPPPGLSAKGGGGGGSLANGWTGQLGAGSGSSAPWTGTGNSLQRNSGSWTGSGGASQWLLLRNLTAQIDGSTLRTLCMQHGPLQKFHLHLHQGFALAKYSSREEAIKAQTALNNCVLSNTTILADNPTEWEANSLLSGGWRNAASTKQAGDTWSTGWPNNQSNLWGNSTLDPTDPARATPSSLNSLLPNDLLGGESM